MRIYSFGIEGGIMEPTGEITDATDNTDFYRKLALYEQNTGLRHLQGSIICTISEVMRVPEPPAVTSKPKRSFNAEEAEFANRIGTPDQYRT